MNWTAQEYMEWVTAQIPQGCTLSEQDEKHVRIEHGIFHAAVNLYPQDIVELVIADDQDNITFYLHFHVEHPDHDQDLTQQMFTALLQSGTNKQLKVLLTCTSGLTTSYFAEQLNQASDLLKLDCSFSAVPFSEIYQSGFDYDIILLAPQVGYQYKKAKEIFQEQLVLKIPADIFAGYQTGKLIDLIKAEYRKKLDEGIPDENINIRSIYENPYRILTIAVIGHKDQKRFGYRIYDHGKKTLDKEVIKPNANAEDMFDLLDYVLTRHHNIDYIGISLPGVTEKGTVNDPELGYHHYNLAREVMVRYHHKAMIINDVNAMALGYHAMHEDTDDMVFYFQPRGTAKAGAGLILDGHLRMGYKHNAGEILRLIDTLYPNGEEMIMNPAGAMKIVATTMLTFISTIAPEKIVYFSELTPNPEEIIEVLSNSVERNYIPELIHVNRLKRYQLPGTMIRCLEIMKHDSPVGL